MPGISIYATDEYLNPAHRASSNLRKLFRLAAGRKISPLLPVHRSYLSFTMAVSLPQMPAQEHVAGHCAIGAFAGTKEPGKPQLFLAHDFILELRLAASFV